MAGMVNLEKNFTSEQNARAALCAADLKALLSKYKCDIMAMPYITLNGTIETEIHVVPLKDDIAERLLKEVGNGRNQ